MIDLYQSQAGLADEALAEVSAASLARATPIFFTGVARARLVM